MASYTELVATDEALEEFLYNSENHKRRVFRDKNAEFSPPIHRSAIALKEALYFFNTGFSYTCNGRAYLIFAALTCANTTARTPLHESTTHDCVPVEAPSLRHPETGEFTGKTLLSILWIAAKFELGSSAPSAGTFILHCALCADTCPLINDRPSCTMTLLRYESYIFSLTFWALNCFHLHDIATAYIWGLKARSNDTCDERIRAELQPLHHILLQKCDEWIVFSYSPEREMAHPTLADIARTIVLAII